MSKLIWSATKLYIAGIFKYNVKLNISNILNTIKDMGDYLFPIKKITNKFDFLLHMAATSAKETFNGETDTNKTKTLFNGAKNIMNLIKNFE